MHTTPSIPVNGTSTLPRRERSIQHPPTVRASSDFSPGMSEDMYRSEGGVKACVDFLAMTGMYVERSWLQTAYCAKSVLILGSGFLLLGYSLYSYSDKISDFAVAFHHFYLLVNVLFIILYYKFKRRAFARIVRELSFSYDYDGHLALEVSNRHRARDKSSWRVVRLVHFLVVYNYITIICIALAESYLAQGEYVLFPCWLPFQLNSGLRYTAVFLWQTLILWEIELGIFGALVASYLVYARTTDELKSLQEALASIRQRAVSNAVTKSDRDRNLILCTYQCATHHDYIISYFNNAQSVFKMVHFIVLTSGLIVMVITGMAFVSDDTYQKVKFVTIAVTEMVYIFGFCWFAEEIAEESTAVGFFAYGHDWTDMPPSCRQTIRLVMTRSNRPLRLTTLAGTDVSLDAYMAIMKAAYSYFNMLFAYHENRQEG